MAPARRLTRIRRRIATALAVLAAFAVALVAAGIWNPWHYTALFALTNAGVAIGVLVLAGALVAAAGLLMFVGAGRGAVVGLTVCLVAVPALCVGLPTLALDRVVATTRTAGPVVMAVSPDGGLSVVKSTFDTEAGPRTQLHIRSRDGLFSRESATPVAECDHDLFDAGIPAESVRFTSETTVAVPISGESTVVVTFDPASLAPDRTVAMCSYS